MRKLEPHIDSRLAEQKAIMSYEMLIRKQMNSRMCLLFATYFYW